LARWVPWLGSAIVLAWLALMLGVDTGLHGDNVEQGIWSHSLEWGYHKHPPLPTWMLGLLWRVLMPTWWWSLVLAASCVVAALWLTWFIACELTDAPTAAAAVLLWGLLQCFSSRAQLFNHNTVLVLCIAATVACALRATRPGVGARAGLLWWLGVGLGAGLSMLAKYQALLPLLGLLGALATSGRLVGRWRFAVGALLLALAVFAPHLRWVFQNDFTTLRYAARSVESADAVQRLRVVASFLVNQLRTVLPALLAMAGAWAWMRLAAPAAGQPVGAAQARVWMIGLFSGPFLFLLLLPLLAGISLRNHWGVQALQFFPLWLAWRWQRHQAVNLSALLVATLAVHGLSMTVYALQAQDGSAMAQPRRIDTAYPGQRMANAALAQWRSVSACPLRYVAGDFEAGLVSAYSGQWPVVADDLATPWVTAAQLAKDGALYVVTDKADLPAGAQAVREWRLAADPLARSVYFGVLAPHSACK